MRQALPLFGMLRRGLLLAPITLLSAAAQSSTALSPAPVPAVSLPAGRVHLSSGIMAGRILFKGVPRMLPLPPDANVSGSTVLHAIIGRDGRVLTLEPISGPEVLRLPLMDAVRQWRYRPWLQDGVPVEVDTTITLHISFGR